MHDPEFTQGLLLHGVTGKQFKNNNIKMSHFDKHLLYQSEIEKIGRLSKLFFHCYILLMGFQARECL